MDKTIKAKLAKRHNFAIGGNNILKFGNMKINKVRNPLRNGESIYAKDNLFKAKRKKKAKRGRR